MSPGAIVHFTLATRDVAATSRFFQAACLWQPAELPANAPRDAAWLQINERQQLHLVGVPDFAPSAAEGEFGRHFAFGWPAADFDALRARLAAAGAELIAPRRATPFRRLFFRDPNGYVFEVIEDSTSDAAANTAAEGFASVRD